MLLCLNAAGWTAIFTLLLVLVTGALVVVTWRLWTSAQNQLATLQAQIVEQRRTTIILYRPFFRVEDLKIVETDSGDSIDGIACKIVNGGESAAWRLRILGNVYVNGKRFAPTIVATPAHLASKEVHVLILPFTVTKEVLDAERPLISVEIKFEYNDLERERNRFSFVGIYDYNRKSWQMNPGGIIEPWVDLQ